MNECVFCGKELHTVGAVHLVDDKGNVVCEKTLGIRRTHQLKAQ